MTTRTLQTVAVARRRRRSGGFDVRRLFINSEAGAWYDPSDLTAEKVAWRRNLYLYSEPTSATGYTATNVTFTTDALFNFLPGGGACAELADATVSRSLRQSFTLTAGVTYTLSFYVTIAGGGLPNSGSGSYRDFTITRDNQDVTTYNTITYENLGGGVYRARHTWLHAGLSGSIFLQKYSGFNNSTAVRLTGLQLEASPTATAYQRITDFTSDFLAAFPTHALYQDSAGTTPVTALGQPVGLAIDKSRGGLASLGANIQNGGFDSDTVWTKNGWTISGGSASYASGAGAAIEQVSPVTLAVGDVVRVTVTVSSLTGGFVYAWVAGNVTSALGISATRTNAVGTYTWFFPIATLTNQNVGIFCGNGPVGVVIDNVSIQRVPGVHAIQPTSASRPLLDGRVNLLERTEEFDNAYWQKAGLGVALVPVVTANAGVAPNGTTTADRLQLDCVNTGSTANRSIVSRALTLTSGTAYAGGVYVKAFDLANVGKTVRFTVEFVQEKLITLTADWQFVALSTLSATGSASNWIVETRGTVTTQTADLLIWGADFRLATDAAYPYQRVAAATDYADVGVPRAFAFDGFDDSLYTASNMNLSGTDKVTVLAGVRKNTDTPLGQFAELTANSDTTNGSWGISAPSSSGQPNLYWSSRGTTQQTVTTTGQAAPVTRVISAIGDISGDLATLRINGVAGTPNTADQGTGNYASAVLFIGRRNNATAPLNGKAYQLIVRGALTDTATLAQAERYVGAKTGLYI